MTKTKTDPTTGRFIASSLKERFWRRVVKRRGCWAWLGCKSEGYGQIDDGDHRMIGAHVVSYRLNVGPVPVGQFVLHACDTPECTRPSHLFVGTQADNMADKARKGRAWRPKGEAHPGAKLTDVDVRSIRADVAGGARGVLTRVARERGLSVSVVSAIARRTAWGHVS